MEASRPIDRDIIDLNRPSTEADCSRSSLEYRFPCLKRETIPTPLLPPDAEFSGSKQAMLNVLRKDNLDHSMLNLRFTLNRHGEAVVINPQVGMIESPKRGFSFETEILGTANTTTKNSPKSSIFFSLELLLDLVTANLDQSKVLSTKQQTSDHVPGAFSGPEKANIPVGLELKKQPKMLLFKLSTESKEVSLGFQEHITDCSPEELESIALKLIDQIPGLIIHQFGNYVIQRLAVRNQVFQKAVVNHCIANFKKLMLNEYASRVLQCLIETEPCFYCEALPYFTKNLEKVLDNQPATHLVISCIKNFKNKSDLRFVPESILKNPKIFWKKGFQRILATYVQICSSSELDEIFEISKVRSKLNVFLGCKTTTYFLANMLLRQHKSTCDLVLDCLSKHPGQLLDTKCWKLLMTKLWEEGSSEITRRVTTTLVNMESRPILDLQRRFGHFNFYIYITLKSLVASELPLFDHYSQRKELVGFFMNLINKKTKSFSSCLF